MVGFDGSGESKKHGSRGRRNNIFKLKREFIMVYTVFKTLRFAVVKGTAFSVDAVTSRFIFTKKHKTAFEGTKDECDKPYDVFVPSGR